MTQDTLAHSQPTARLASRARSSHFPRNLAPRNPAITAASVAGGVVTAALVLGGFYAWSAVSLTAPRVPDGWAAINTAFKFSSQGQYADDPQHMQTIGMVRHAAGQGASVIVLPESAFGLWSTTTKRFWSQELAGLDVRVVGGAAIVDPDGYDSTLVELIANSSKPLYRQRMPVPVSMWQPWTTGGALMSRFLAIRS